MNLNSDFILTKEYRKFSEFCRACQRERYIGLCYGPPGVGKSMSASHFANWSLISKFIEKLDKKNYLENFEEIEKMDVKKLNTIIFVPEIQSTSTAVIRKINNLVWSFNYVINSSIFLNKNKINDLSIEDISINSSKNNVELIIIDEADRLQPKALEAIRDIYDRGIITCREDPAPSVILIGMPGIEKRLIRFPQLYSRIGFVHSFKLLNEDEVKFILQNQLKNLSIKLSSENFSDKEAIATITRITQGNFRLINRLLKQSIRIMQVNQLSTISKEVVEAARECLVIGNV